MTNPKKIRITAYIDADVLEVLRECVFLKNTIRSDMINDALRHYLHDIILDDLYLMGKISTEQLDNNRQKLV